MNKATIRWMAAALLALLTQLTSGANAPAPQAKDVAAKTAPGADMTETDMSHTGSTPQGKVTVPWNLLGGAVGDRTVNGVKVELYVLQAQDLEKLRPGDPNHAFTVTLKDEKSSEFLKQGKVSILVTGDAGTTRRSEMSTRSSGIFRSGVALPRPGEYRVTIDFKSAGHAGQAEFAYVFGPNTQPMPAHHH